MTSKNLLTQLTDLESSLNNFSFEELTSEEAIRLQNSFRNFKNQLENRVWGEDGHTDAEADPGGDPTREENRRVVDELRRIAAVTHLMKTSISGITGMGELLKESKLTEEQSHQVHTILAAGRNLTNIVNELWEYSQLLGGLETFENVPFNIHTLVQDVKYLCETLIVNKGLEIQLDMDSAIPGNLQGDPSKITQILLQLLGNTIKRVQSGSVNLNLQLNHQVSESVFLEFQIGSVTTDGTTLGTMKKARMSHLETHSESGLGLSIVRRIIEQLGGEFLVQGDASGLEAYAFRLPLSKPRKNPSNDTPAKTQEGLKGLQVLVLDINPLNQKALERKLNAWGCIPWFAENPLQGRQFVDGKLADLVLVDINTTGNEALELTRKIRSINHPEIRETPIIALSTRLTDTEQKRYTQEGITHFLFKPYGAEELQKVLLWHKEALRKRHNSLASGSNGQVSFEIERDAVDLLPVLEDCMGKMETLEELIAIYKKKALEFIGSVKLHLDRSDFEGVGYSCQKISGSLKLFRTERLLELVEQIHKSSRTFREVRHLRVLHQCFVAEYPKVEAKIDAALRKLKES